MTARAARRRAGLTPDEEARLASDDISPSERSVLYERAVLTNLGLLRRLAVRLHTKCPTVEIEDLEQAGVLGVLRAVRTYDPAKGRFVTYMSWWAHRYMIEALQHSRIKHRLSKEKSKGANYVLAKEVPLESTLPPSENPFDDMVHAFDIAPPTQEASTIAQERRKALQRAMSRLTIKQRTVLARRLAGEGLEEIGRTLRPRLSRERIRQIEREAIDEVAHCLRRWLK